MIITQLTGGLGNQMFQYAIGKVLCVNNEDELFLDLTLYTDTKNGDTQRNYELGIFGIDTPEASLTDRTKLGDENPILKLINKVFHTNINTYPTTLVKESGHFFQPEILSLKGDIYLRGFWQSEKYFSSHRDLILNTFRFAKRKSKKSTELMKKIIVENSIAVHVRRGDYVTNPNAKKYHGLCRASYYHKAGSALSKQISNPIFYVFSDDPAWCKNNLKFPGKTIFVTHNTGNRSWEDMWLMSSCKHHIIANSSFSWWGAWLCNNTNKIVIAPAKWVADPIVEMPDIIPEGWIRL